MRNRPSASVRVHFYISETEHYRTLLHAIHFMSALLADRLPNERGVEVSAHPTREVRLDAYCTRTNEYDCTDVDEPRSNIRYSQ